MKEIKRHNGQLFEGLEKVIKAEAFSRWPGDQYEVTDRSVEGVAFYLVACVRQRNVPNSLLVIEGLQKGVKDWNSEDLEYLDEVVNGLLKDENLSPNVQDSLSDIYKAIKKLRASAGTGTSAPNS